MRLNQWKRMFRGKSIWILHVHISVRNKFWTTEMSSFIYTIALLYYYHAIVIESFIMLGDVSTETYIEVTHMQNTIFTNIRTNSELHFHTNAKMMKKWAVKVFAQSYIVRHIYGLHILQQTSEPMNWATSEHLEPRATLIINREKYFGTGEW